eukprot:gene7578-8869_t
MPLEVKYTLAGKHKDEPKEPVVLSILNGHTKDVSYLAWSPDDKLLLSASGDTNLKLWSVDDASIVSPENSPMSGLPIKAWTCARVNDLAIHKDGRQLIVICQEKKIRIYDLENERPEISIAEMEAITSMQLSDDCKYVLINTSNQEIHLWDLERKNIVQKYRGQRQSRFVIRSCFGGVDQAFVLSGSEDSNIYIWHRQNGTLLETLSGHEGTVNSVCWSPTDPYLLIHANVQMTASAQAAAERSKLLIPASQDVPLLMPAATATVAIHASVDKLTK